MACDPAAFQSYNLKSKTVRITRDDYKDYAKAVLEYHFIRYNELLDYIKLYANYVILVQPAANILLDDYDDKIKIVEKVTKECYEASKDNKDFDFQKNQGCVDIVGLYSSKMFSVPSDFKMSKRTLGFFHTLVKSLGSLKYTQKHSEMVPLGIAPQEYIIFNQRQFGANRILAGGVNRANSKAKEMDHRLKNHNQKPQKSKNQSQKFGQTDRSQIKLGLNLRAIITHLWTLSFQRVDGDAITEFLPGDAANTKKDAKKRDLQSQQAPEASTNEQTPADTSDKKDDATIKPIDLTKYKNNGFATEVRGGYLLGLVSMAMATLYVLM